MKLSVALRLGRVSNLPTVTSNVLAAIALAGKHPAPLSIAIICTAMSLLYVAGMYLNDAFDREIDRVERPERPIPAGEVSAALVFDLGFAMLAAGVALICALALMTGAGWWPIASATVLGGLIVFYNASHKHNPLAPLVMGLCRAAVYTTAALCVRPDLCAEVLIGTATLVAYLIGLTYVARSENLADLGSSWPLGFLAVPFLVVIPHGWFAIAIYAGFLIWVLRALTLVTGRQIRGGVTSLIAGISLLDALWLAREGRPAMALVAVIAFFATTILQRRVPGT